MTRYRNAVCWAAAILGVAGAGIFEVIDKASTTTLLIALPVVAWMALRGRLYCPLHRSA